MIGARVVGGRPETKEMTMPIRCPLFADTLSMTSLGTAYAGAPQTFEGDSVDLDVAHDAVQRDDLHFVTPLSEDDAAPRPASCLFLL